MVIYLEINFINMEGTLSNYCLDKYDSLRDTSIFSYTYKYKYIYSACSLSVYLHYTLVLLYITKITFQNNSSSCKC